jgi:predicted GNAT family acetyltransferase
VPSPSSSADVRHDTSARRFTIDADGTLAVLEYREIDAQTLDYYHTFVPQALRGGGIASRLADAALRDAREHGRKVVPTCSFIAAYIARHPEFRPLVR